MTLGVFVGNLLKYLNCGPVIMAIDKLKSSIGPYLHTNVAGSLLLTFWESNEDLSMTSSMLYREQLPVRNIVVIVIF